MNSNGNDYLTDNWGALRTLNLYRWTITALLLGLWWSRLGSRLLPGVSEELLPLLCGLYLIASPVLSLSLLFQRPGFQFQVYIHAGIDIALTTLLVMVCGGMSSGLGVLILTPVAGIGTLIPRRIAVLLAAIASLSLLGEEIFRDLSGLSPAADYTLAGLVGILVFIVSFAANTLARRASASARLAEQRGLDLANLSHLNERIIHHMAVGVIVLDDQDGIRMMNQAATRLLNANARAINRRPLSGISAQLAQQLTEWREGNRSTHDGDIIELGGHRLLPHFSRLGHARGPALVFLEDANRFGEQAQQIKLAALGRLTASIAHEIRNPLGAISHASQLIQGWKNSPEEEERLLAIIDRHCQRINQIIENVLNLSKRQETMPQAISLKTWLGRLLNEYRQSHLGQHSELILKQIPDNLEIRFDPSHLQQVLTNLWDNAAHHGQRNNGITMINMSAGLDTDSGRPYLDICDDGPGIPDELAEQIFEPFFTIRHDGTGLGLYLARELCECNHASLRHMPGAHKNGACFRILFANSLEWAA